MTIAFSHPIGGFAAFVLIALAVVMVVAGIGAVVVPSIHATVKHGTDAEMARSCLQNKGSIIFKNPTTNRFGVVCNTEEGWGIVILDSADHEITSFLKNKMKDFSQVLQYMKNAGYGIVH